MQADNLETLEQAEFTRVQARAIARVLDAETSHSRGDLATKLDLMGLKTDLVRWMFVTVMGQMAVLSGIMYFFAPGHGFASLRQSV